MPSGFTVPSRIGHDRGLAAVARLSVSRMMMVPVRLVMIGAANYSGGAGKV
jgi:hypothetical protein